MFQVSPDGGDQPPWLTEVFFDLSALDFCPDDKTGCHYLLNFYTHPYTLDERKPEAASDVGDVESNGRQDSVEDEDKNGRRQVREPCPPLCTPVPNTLVKMCSVRAERPCAKSRCISKKFVHGGDLQDHFDMLIENIFNGAFLAERKILATFFKNDLVPIQVSKEKFPRSKGPVLFSPSVELFSDRRTDKKSTSTENHSSKSSVYHPARIQKSLNSGRPVESAQVADEASVHRDTSWFTSPQKMQLNESANCIRGRDLANQQQARSLTDFSLSSDGDLDTSVLVAMYLRLEIVPIQVTVQRGKEYQAGHKDRWSTKKLDLHCKRSENDHVKNEQFRGTKSEICDRKPRHVCVSNSTLCRMDGVKCDKLVNHSCDTNMALCRLDGIKCERITNGIPVCTGDNCATLCSLNEGNS